MKLRYRHICVSALGAFLYASTVNAQTPAGNAGAAQDLTEVVVTGSRVVTNGNDSPTPVTVLNIEEMQAVRPSSVADQLNDMPQFSSSQGPQGGIGNGGANGGNPNGAGNVLNLRNFGTTRNLVLFDGHRIAPNSGNGTVSIDMIPQMLLKRVDVVTGGASAVYGADAVTGVINFITDTKFQGLKINGQLGRSGQNDDNSSAYGLAGGTDLFGGRGHIMGSYEYHGDAGIDNRSDRDWGAKRWFMAQVVNPAGVSSARYLVPYGTRQDAAFGGLIQAIRQPGSSATSPVPVNPLNNYQFVSNGVLAPLDRGVTIPGSNRARDGSAGSGSYFDQSLKASLYSHQIFGRFDFDFTDSLHGYFKATGTNTFNAGYAISSPLAQASDNNNIHAIFVSNPFLPAAYRTQMQNAGLTVFGLNKVMSGPGMDQYRQFTEVSGRNYAYDTGLSGSFGDSWKWELALVYDKDKLLTHVNNALNTKKVGAALDAVTPAGGGAPVCWVSTQPQFASLYPGCVAYNVFGPSITPQEAGYIFDTLTNTTNTKMQDVEAFISGSPFNSWAGPVNIAVSGQGRKLTYELVSSVEPAGITNPLDCQGLRLDNIAPASQCNPTQSQLYFQGFSYTRTPISVDVKEAALEFNLPLLADKFLARDVSFSGAFRYTNYSTSGSVNSWKAGLDWKLSDALTFRGTRSRDIRAPTMQELYAPAQIGSYSGEDFWVHGPIVPPAAQITSGNANLKPELADTTTLGFVARPDWAQGLSVALDYYYIKVQDAIVNQNGATDVAMTTCGNSGGTSSLCDLIVRPIDCCSRSTNNYATKVYSAPVNIARQWTEGVDLEVNYSNRMFDKPYNLRLLTSYQPHNVNVDTLGLITTENAGAITGNPKWRATLLASMSLTEKLKLSVLERWREGMLWYPIRSNGLDVVVNSTGITSVAYTNLNLGYSLDHGDSGKTELFLNIQNLFDKEPPVFASPGAPFPGLNGTYPGDDGVGRYFTMGFRYRL